MAIIGISTNRENPTFTTTDFCLWMPQFKNFIATEDGLAYFNEMYAVANEKIFYSIWGSDWKLAMSYCIAHYLTLVAQQLEAPSGDTLSEVAGGGVSRGVLTGASVGGFSKSYGFDYTAINSPEALFWNQTSYGMSLMALYKTKAVASIFVVTPGPVPGASDVPIQVVDCT